MWRAVSAERSLQTKMKVWWWYFLIARRFVEPLFCGEVFVMEQEEIEAAPKCAATLVIHISDTKPLASGVLPSLHSHLMHCCSAFMSAHECVRWRKRSGGGSSSSCHVQETSWEIKPMPKINFHQGYEKGSCVFFFSQFIWVLQASGACLVVPPAATGGAVLLSVTAKTSSHDVCSFFYGLVISLKIWNVSYLSMFSLL